MSWFGRIFSKKGSSGEVVHTGRVVDPRDSRPARPNPRYRVDPLGVKSTITWEGLTEILGPAPYGPPGTSVSPAGGVYGEANPNAQAAAKRDEEIFFLKTGRKPSREEGAMILQRWLGWGYES